MIATAIFWIGLIVSIGIGFVYFRDLGDVSQMVLKVKRENMLRFIRHEYTLIGVGIASAAVMVLAYFGFGGGPGWVFWPAMALVTLFYAFPLVYVHLGLRNQSSSAQYFPIEEARRYVAPANRVVVSKRTEWRARILTTI